MTENRTAHARGLLDTSVISDLEVLRASQLPEEVAISAITLAELSAGPNATADPTEVPQTPLPPTV